MQVSLDAVDWKWLTSLSPPRARIDAMLDGTGNESGHIEMFEPFEDWISSAILHEDIWDAIEYWAKDAEKTLSARLLAAWAPLLSGEEEFDELNLSDLSEGCFHLSLSPASVKRIVTAMDKLDLPMMAHEINPDEEKDVLTFLTQRAAVVRLAKSKGWGIVGHMG
jgi:hypothetical protein